MKQKGKNGGTLNSFEKGQSGNTNGRPKKPGLISQILKELGNEVQDMEITITSYSDGQRPVFHHSVYATDGEQTFNAYLAARLLMYCMQGNIEAIKIVLDRTEGRIPPPMNIDFGGSSNPMTVVYITDEKELVGSS